MDERKEHLATQFSPPRKAMVRHAMKIAETLLTSLESCSALGHADSRREQVEFGSVATTFGSDRVCSNHQDSSTSDEQGTHR